MKKIVPFSKEISFKTRIAEITDIEITHNLEKTPFNTIDGNFLVNGSYKMTDASVIEEKFSYTLPFTIEVDEKYDLADCKIKISDFFFEIMNEDTLKVHVEVELSDVDLKKEEISIEESLIADEDSEDPVERCYDHEDDEEEKEESMEELDTLEEPNIMEESDTLEEERPSEQSGADVESQEEIPQPIDILDQELPIALEKIPTEKITSASNTSNASSKSISDIFPSVNNEEDTFQAYYVYIVRENDTLDSILSKYHVTRDEVSEYNDLNDLKIGSKLVLPCSKNE